MCVGSKALSFWSIHCLFVCVCDCVCVIVCVFVVCMCMCTHLCDVWVHGCVLFVILCLSVCVRM